MEPGRRSPKPRNSCNSRVRWASKAERKSGTGGASFLRVITLSESRLDPGEASSPNSYVAHLVIRGLLTTLRNGAIYELKGPPPADCCSTNDRKWTSRRRPNMNAKILTFSSHGDTALLEYDPATADMDEVNRVIAEYEAKTGAQPFDMATGERISKATSEQREVLMVHPIAGG